MILPTIRACCVVAGVVATLVVHPTLAFAGGDAERGRAVFLDRELGHCVLCHQVAELDVPFQGDVGPSLSGIAERMAIEDIRAKVVDPTVSNPDTAMPAYHRTTNLNQVAREYQGKPVLDERQLDDLIAYLATLRAPAAQAGDEG